MDLRQYIRVLRAHWVLISVSVLVSTGVAAYLAWSRAPTYEVHTQLFVANTRTSSKETPSDIYVGSLFTQQRVVSYSELVSSPPVVRAIAARLGLPAQSFPAKIHASVPTGSVLIDVTVTDRMPERAKAIADAVSSEFPSFVNSLETPKGQHKSPVKISVTSPGQLPTSPVAPKKKLYLVLGALLGLVLGVLGAVLREALDRRIRNSDDAAAITGAPVLGSITRDRRAKRNHPLVMLTDPGSTQAEEYRRLRTNLGALRVDQDLRSIAISSAVACDAKTPIAANLGIAFAQADLRVALVDSDLRRPRLANFLGLPSSTGVTDVLLSGVALETALQTWQEGLPLEVLAAGSSPWNPGELLGGSQFTTLLGRLTARFDVVILDAPAVLPTSDAAALARATSGVVLVTPLRSLTNDELTTATHSLWAVETRVLGVVVERSRARGAAADFTPSYVLTSSATSQTEIETDLPLRVRTNPET